MTAADTNDKDHLVLLDQKKPNGRGRFSNIFRCCLPTREGSMVDGDDDSTLASSTAPIMSISYLRPLSTNKRGTTYHAYFLTAKSLQFGP
jgi:hypothetical protein